MEESNCPEKQPNEGNNSPFGKKPISDTAIVGFNMLALVIYTLMCRINGDSGAFLIDAILILIHLAFCLYLSNGKRGKAWLLSAGLVLVIGFSTCTLI